MSKPLYDGPARNFKTGAVRRETCPRPSTIKQVREGALNQFIQERMMTSGDEKFSLFAPIKNPRIDTRLKKIKDQSSTVDKNSSYNY